jgi:hypothetical protein
MFYIAGLQTVITIVKYPKWFGWIGFHSMALFHIPLFLNSNVSFYKLLGTGKNGTFDKTPDFNQWGVLVVLRNKVEPNSHFMIIETAFGNFMSKWWKWSRVKKLTMVLQAIEGHGKWDGKEAFGALPRTSDYDGEIAILTRASIRLNKVNAFWKNVAPVAAKMNGAEGLITSIGVGEVPWIKQATLSIWKNKESMKNFAYKMQEHQQVIQKTRKENWYSEEMFVRFKINGYYKDEGYDTHK